MISKYCITREFEPDVYAWYNSLCPDPVFFSRKTTDDVRSGMAKKQVLDLLTEHHICLSSDEDERLYRHYLNANRSMNGKIDTLYLILTAKCNLACRYCVVEPYHNNCIVQSMDKSVMEKSLDLFSKTIRKNSAECAQVVFYGGEPLLTFDLIKHAIDYCKKLGIRATFSLITNGTCIDARIANYIYQNHIQVSISLDGPANLNDINRVFRNDGSGSYSRAIEGLHCLVAGGNNVGVSLTITNDIFQNESMIIDWINDLPIVGVYCNLLHTKDVLDESLSQLYKESAGFCGKINNTAKVNEGRFQRRLSSFLRSDFIFSDCAAVGMNQVAIEPNGDIYICHCVRNRPALGNINTIDSFEKLLPSAHQNAWYSFSPIEHLECLTCPGISICGGGCGGIRTNNTNSGWKKDIPFCHYTLRMIDLILSDIFRERGLDDEFS